MALHLDGGGATQPRQQQQRLSPASREHDVDTVMAATKVDALRGLRSCLDAASTQRSAVATVQPVVDFLLR